MLTEAIVYEVCNALDLWVNGLFDVCEKEFALD